MGIVDLMVYFCVFDVICFVGLFVLGGWFEVMCVNCVFVLCVREIFCVVFGVVFLVFVFMVGLFVVVLLFDVFVGVLVVGGVLGVDLF